MTVEDLTFIDDESITESMYEVLEALLDAMPVLGNPPGPATNVTLQGAIEIICGQPAVLTLRTDQSVAFKLAQGWSLVGENGPEAEDAVDALSEFTNLVGGSMKFLFAEESSLGIPEVDSFDQTPAAGDGNWVDVDHVVGRFQVQVRPAAQ